MIRLLRVRRALALLAAAVVLAPPGCSRYPSPPKRPHLDPEAVGRAAMEQYDANHDGKLDDAEMKKSPALLEALSTIDADQDGLMTETEIVARAEVWKKSPTIVTSAIPQVLLDGKPLEGATVTFEPEPFMGEAYQASKVVTNPYGMGSMPGQDAKHPGLYMGLYRVRISKLVNGREVVPAWFNVETNLGKEICPNSPSTDCGYKYDLSTNPALKDKGAPPRLPVLVPVPMKEN